ncbi:PAP2 superfamily protein [Entomoplasma freundtii]|uniref:Phosphatidic acid phosphatase type 2/haloperoxidase domain-containing protein n=2 Tax=Entomoplasma freundtii TaxID=74700 RepID=A0A2K8NQZ4_9MOLU|nr:phosphatase PAP2 family protein [Entomoplasma freundtii]ATZ16207.1 hypothetical protein EFREU_v1c01800 [Entomoplasma freundtii]TDY56892.1 PAP2 superfamily protein [Entomoplasma freundtii]
MGGGFVLLVLFILGTLYDREIANWFLPHHENNFFGLYFEILGYGIYTIPLTIILAICRNFWKLKNNKMLTGERELGLWTLIFLLFGFLDSLGLFKNHQPFAWITWVIVLFTYAWFYAFILWYYHQPNQLLAARHGHYHWQTFLAMVIYIIGTYLTVFIFKVIFVRPRILAVVAGDAVYQPWWSVSWNPYRFKNNSFPSGHVAITLSLLSVLYLLKPRKKPHFWMALGIWTIVIIMACSRIVYNKHYLTDTLMAMIIAVAWFYFGKWINHQKWLNKWDFNHDYIHCHYQKHHRSPTSVNKPHRWFIIEVWKKRSKK